MSKLVYVQAQADHIASLSKAAPLAALEELIWNALDADAREVRVDLVLNMLEGVDAIRVSDDGTGIDVLKADSTFGSLGGSWKRDAAKTPLSHRRLHGRQGRGRFKAFALGHDVEWRTTVREGSELLSYKIHGELANPGVFEIESVETGPAMGTEVYITNVTATTASLLKVEETVQTLASRFALYLKSYPNVRIYFNGIPVTPLIVQKEVTDYRLTLPSGAEAKLEIIEWRRRFTGAGKLVFAGADGFCLYETAAGTRPSGVSFTAYLISARFAALHAENMLVMDELDPEVRQYLDSARKLLKAHFAAQKESRATQSQRKWLQEGSYPYATDDLSPQRQKFDALATEFAARFEDFAAFTSTERKMLFGILNRVLKSNPDATPKSLLD